MQETSMELPDPMTNKSAARAWARAQSRAAGPGELMDWGRSFEQLLAIMREHVGKSTDPVVMVYVPIIGEPDPIMLLSSSISMGWRAAVGRGTSRTSTLQVVAVDPKVIDGGVWHRDQCEPDAWGMLVPRDRVPVAQSEVAAVVVPGMAFDRAGHRLGRGAGVYDRFLAALPASALRIGLVPSNRLVERLPTDPHDVPMHVVATEREVLRTPQPA
jgi:5,10-methenyltetrahydrofolate synthetase